MEPSQTSALTVSMAEIGVARRLIKHGHVTAVVVVALSQRQSRRRTSFFTLEDAGALSLQGPHEKGRVKNETMHRSGSGAPTAQLHSNSFFKIVGFIYYSYI